MRRGTDKDGNLVYLRDIWPSSQEIADAVNQVNTAMFHKEYAEVFAGDEQRQAIEVPQAATYAWQDDSTYSQHHRSLTTSAARPRGQGHRWPGIRRRLQPRLGRQRHQPARRQSRHRRKLQKIEVLCRIDTLNEVEYFKSGGILHYVLRQLIAS
ncbi:hypothetical protein PS710_02847 [Pseudomonas fluorescens]|uniref:Aconitate hydratase n=1 Tax=Pseudomonas fluorescens TaxID=294 RepID=A0A5E7CF31_PSEFL|nr:hypothetical protein PS710_02847 [Pseudomonas fluorescens]